jgi:hypothetical protein
VKDRSVRSQAAGAKGENFMAGDFLLMLANAMLWIFILGLHVARDKLTGSSRNADIGNDHKPDRGLPTKVN